MNRVVIYYSLTGNTKDAAETIKTQLDADIIELKTVKKLSQNNFKKFMIGGMRATFGMCAKLEKIEINLSKYDEIILGTPIWAGKCVPAINTLLRDKKIADEVFAIFTVSGGGDNDKCIANLKKRLPNMKHTIALADCNNELSKKNQTSISKFVEEILGGE